MTPEPPDIDGEGLVDAPRAAYDVCNPDRLPADRVVFVDGIHEQFLQTFGLSLATYLDTPVEAVAAGLDQLPLGKFLELSATDACLLTLELAPMRGQAWVGLSAGFVFRVLDILLGAPANTAPATRTTITEIEQHVLREFFHTLLTTLGAAWAHSGISLRLASIGIAEDALKDADPDGTALILNSKVKINEAEESFRIAMPVLAVRLAALQNEQDAAGQVASETSARSTMLSIVSGATLQLEAVLGGSAIRLGDLAAMQAGQVLMLTQPAGSQLECLVNGKAKYRGEWIAHGDRQGFQVDAVVDPAASGKH